MTNGGVSDFQINGESMAAQLKKVIQQGEADDNSDSSPPGHQQAQMENALLAEVYNPNPEEESNRLWASESTAPASSPEGSFVLMGTPGANLRHTAGSNSHPPNPANGAFNFGAFGGAIQAGSPRPATNLNASLR